MARQRSHIYINQPYITQLDTETDLDTADTLQIRYKKPDGSIDYLTATETASGSGILQAAISGAVNDQAGQWELRAWVIFSGDPNPVPGTPVRVIVEKVV